MNMHFLPRLLLAAALVCGCATAPPAAGPVAPGQLSASDAFEKQDTGAFLAKHASFLARAKSGPIGVLFLGDSITDRWRIAPQIWEKYYGKYDPANFGIGGDRTQNVIWRIEHGELDGIQPKVLVLMLGTNNSFTYTAAEIAAADRKIVAMIRARLPDTCILLLGVFPRGPRDPKGGPIDAAAIDDAARRMVTIRALNRDLAKLDDGKMIRYLDIGHVFLAPDGQIPEALMPDRLHPGPAGYQLWADAMQPLLDEMMQASGTPHAAAYTAAYTADSVLRTQFQVEGDTPYPAPYAGTLNFSALASKFDSGHGHGYRNELKLAPALRRGVQQTREHFSARVTPTLPAGAKTIVAQYHGEGLETLVKVYVQDTFDVKGLDGKAGNGVFDVLVRILGTDGKEVTTALGTVRSGEALDLDIRCADGAAQVAVTTPGTGRIETARVALKDAGRNIYFKFGDYLQALDPATQQHTIVAAQWDAYYRQQHIDRTLIAFSNVRFEREAR